MKFRTPLVYDKNGEIIGYWENEIPLEKIAQIRWAFAQSLKNCKETFRTPIFEDEVGEDEN